MILLFDDFGWHGPYVGQVKIAIAARAPDATVIDLMHDAPSFQPKIAAYFLAALIQHAPADAIVLAVVDPQVGGERLPVMVQADGRRLVGPDNGLLVIAARRAKTASWSEIVWRPEHMSESFHARDLFAPVAAMLHLGEEPRARPMSHKEIVGEDWPDDLYEIISLDHYGNAITGVRASEIPDSAVLEVAGRKLTRRRTFCDAEKGEPFWYENSIGLIEIACAEASAAVRLSLWVGMEIYFEMD